MEKVTIIRRHKGTIDKITIASAALLAITLNISRLNPTAVKHRVAGWVTKQI